MKARLSAALALVAVALAGCTVHQTEAPGLTGPSGLALTLNVNANPDTVSHDGGSQSSIKVTAIGPDGRGVRGQTIRMDMRLIAPAPNCSVEKPCVQDYGSFSARSIVTDGEGVAFTVYTAPPSPAGGLFETCGPLPGTCVDIVATATGGSGGSAEAATSQSTRIRLVPPGFIQPVAGSPTAAFSFSPQPAAANVPMLFDASASQVGTGASQIVSYNWTFGDGTSGTGKTVTHTYAAQNSYTVMLKVTNDRTRSHEFSQSVSVGAGSAPTVDFVFSPAAPVVNQTVNFDASQARPGAGHRIASYAWNFGDGSTKTGVTTTHDFGSAGTFNVVLTVTDEAGQATTVAKAVPIATGGGTGGGGATTASFVASPTAPVVGQVVFFNASGSTAATGHTLTKYAWDFGDGTTFVGSTSSASHTFTTVGTFTVGLIVTDDTGQTAKFAGTVTVAPAGNVAPSARFTSSPSGPGVNQDVFFNASSSAAAPGHTIVTYAWDFGDGSSGAGVSVTHAYGRSGSFTVTLVVTDDVGQTGTFSSGVTVVANSSQIVAEFVFSPTDPSIGATVFFDATPSSSPSAITGYAWDFGDGSTCGTSGPACTGSNTNPQHAFAAPIHTWIVRLTITDAAGRTATVTHNVTTKP